MISKEALGTADRERDTYPLLAVLSRVPNFGFPVFHEESSFRICHK